MIFCFRCKSHKSLSMQIVRSGAEADVWGLYARWHKMKGDLVMCSEALLKQVRSYQVQSQILSQRGI